MYLSSTHGGILYFFFLFGSLLVRRCDFYWIDGGLLSLGALTTKLSFYLFGGSNETFLDQVGILSVVRKYESLFEGFLCSDVRDEFFDLAIS